MRFVWLIVMSALGTGTAGPALAQDSEVLKVAGCQILVAEKTLRCGFSNASDATIGWIEFDVEVIDAGREMRWGRGQGEVTVWGGIAPGEAQIVNLLIEDLPPRADGRDLEWRFEALSARDASGFTVEAPSGGAQRRGQ